MPPLLSYSQKPFVRFLLALTTGILTRELLAYTMLPYLIWGVSLLLLANHFLPVSPLTKFRTRMFFGTGTFLFLFATGYFIADRNIRTYFRFPSSETIAAIRVEDSPVEKTETYRAYGSLQLNHNQNTGKSSETEIPLILYFRKDSTFIPPARHDLILARCRISPIRNAGNPDEFDYAAYMHRKGVYYSATIYSFDTIGNLATNTLRGEALAFRDKLLDNFRKSTLSAPNRALFEAILLGEREELTTELRNDFSGAGLSHILSVSGLHTGIILLIVLTILWPLRWLGLSKMIFAAAILLMWGYAFLTGLSASVVRAVTMITILLGGKMMDEKSDSVNTLFAAAFLMLLVNPEYLFEVGFQLSYLSVLSILIFYPRFKKTYINLHPLLQRIADFANLSVSAQLLTLPFSIYYFHIFPLAFLPANLFTVPILIPFTIAGLIHLLLLQYGIELSFLGRLLEVAADYITGIAAAANRLTGRAGTAGWYPDVIEIGLYFLLLLTALLYFEKRKATRLMVFMTALCGVLLWGHLRPVPEKAEMVIFNQNESNAVHIRMNRKLFCYTPDSTVVFERTNRISRPYRDKMKLEETCYIQSDTLVEGFFESGYPLMRIGNRHFMWFTEYSETRMRSEHPFECDYALIGGRYRGTTEQMGRLAHMKKIILLPTLPAYYRKKIKAECDSSGIRCHDIREEGAFRLDESIFKNPRSDED